MSSEIRRIAINTGGGDAPGLNAVIQAAVCAAYRHNWEIVGIREGYDGILYPQDFPEGGLVQLRPDDVEDIARVGGTILGTTNRGNPFRIDEAAADGSIHEVDRSDEVLASFRMHQIDALIAVGGDGSLGIAYDLYRKGLRLVGVPKTIDNDLDATTMTFGFHSAVAFATECIDRLQVTAQAHRRIMVVEVMGRNAGWIALNAGIAGGADAILIPEIPYDINRVAAHLKARSAAGRKYSIIVVAEGAFQIGRAHV